MDLLTLLAADWAIRAAVFVLTLRAIFCFSFLPKKSAFDA
jgi:hypothetical protein